MRSEAATVAEYLQQLAEDARKLISVVRKIIRKNLPKGIEERMNWGMISYEMPLTRHPKTYNGQPLMYAALAAQGGDASIVDYYALLPQPKTTIEVKAPRSGFITHIDTYQAGMFTVDLGAGRKKADDQIDYAAGVMFDRRSGDDVKGGDVIARIQLGSGQRDAEQLRTQFLSFVEFGDAPPEKRPLVHERLA